MWIFKEYFPKQGGGCGSSISASAKFYTLLAYNNLKGFELTSGGAIQTINFTLLDNKEAGLEFTNLVAPWGENGPLVKDSLVVGHSDVSGDPSACTQGGLVAPQSSHLTVSGTTFVNFDAPSCAALRGCSFCHAREGGFITRFEKTQLINSPNKAAFKWEHESVFKDVDGSLTGKSAVLIIKGKLNLYQNDKTSCQPSARAILGYIGPRSWQYGQVGQGSEVRQKEKNERGPLLPSRA